MKDEGKEVEAKRKGIHIETNGEKPMSEKEKEIEAKGANIHYSTSK